MRSPSGIPTIGAIVIAVVIVIAVLLLVGCNDEDRKLETEVRQVPFNDKTVSCIILKEVSASETDNVGIACDWSTAK